MFGFLLECDRAGSRGRRLSLDILRSGVSGLECRGEWCLAVEFVAMRIKPGRMRIFRLADWGVIF